MGTLHKAGFFGIMHVMTFEHFLSSPIKIRLIKFFVYNHNKFFDIKDVAHRLNIPLAAVRKHAQELRKEGFLKSRSATSFSISYRFPYLQEIKGLVMKLPPASDEFLEKEAKKIGNVKALIIAGLLVHAEKARAEIILIGDRISEKKAEKFLHAVEAQAAKELRYVLLSTEEFLYRKKMFDRFVLDVLEFPHRTLINKLKI